MSSSPNSQVLSVRGTKKGQRVQPSRLLDYQGEQSHAVVYRYGKRFPSPEVRCRESVLRFFYPSLSLSPLDKDQDDPTRRREKLQEFERAKQRRDVFLLAFHAVQQLPPTDKWSYYQIAGIHGLPYEPYDGDTGPWTPGGPNKWWGGYCQHGTPLFPTWHRPYVMLLEQSIIRQARVLADTLFQNLPLESDRKSNVLGDAIKTESAAVKKIIDEELCFPYWDWANPTTRLLGVPDVFTTTEISLLYDWKSFTTRSIPNPLKAFVVPKDVGRVYASSDVYNPAAKPLYRVPPEGIPFTPAGYPTVRHVNSAYESQSDKLNLTVIRNAGSILVEGVYSMFRHKDWLSFSNHYWNEETHGGGKGYDYGHYSSLELVHDELHDTIGGAGGQMGWPDSAGYDPIFFFHHANVDRLLALWQFCYPDKWIDDKLQIMCDGTYTIKPNTTATSDTDLTPFRRSNSDSEFVSSNDVRIVDEDCGYTYPELQTARAENWCPGKMFIHLLDLYRPPQHFVHNWYLVLEEIIKRIFGGAYGIRVFIDKPDATGKTSVSDPHFAGQISIFARSNIAWCANCDRHQTMRANLNLTKTMARLGITIAPEEADTHGEALKAAITLVYVNNRGDQVYPADVGWEGPKLFVYSQEGVKEEGVKDEEEGKGVEFEEDIEFFRTQFINMSVLEKPDPAQRAEGTLKKF